MPMTRELQEHINQVKSQMLPVAQELLGIIHKQMNLDHATGMQPAEMAPAEEKVRTAVIEYQGHIGVGEAPPGGLTSDRPAPSDTSHAPAPGTPGYGPTPGGDQIPSGTFGALSPEEQARYRSIRESLIKILRGIKNLIKVEREELGPVKDLLETAKSHLAEGVTSYKDSAKNKRGDELQTAFNEVTQKLNSIHADLERAKASLENTKGSAVAQEDTFQMELDHRALDLSNLLQQSPRLQAYQGRERAEHYIDELHELRDRLVRRERGDLKRKEQQYNELLALLDAATTEIKNVVLTTKVIDLAGTLRIFDSIHLRISRALGILKEILESSITHDDQTRRRERGVLKAIFGEEL